MTASRSQPRAGRGRRIIERPRLIKLLDESDARTILLLAPAGYGKTTLARQWAKTLLHSLTFTLRASHRDIGWLADEIATELDNRNEEAARLIREHVRARENPQRAATELGAVVLRALTLAGVQWLVLDNYEIAAASPEFEDMVASIEGGEGPRVLLASRIRPRWASGRHTIYGELLELSRDDLAMTEAEVSEVMGKRKAATRIARNAQGWPAVVGLAATLESSRIPETPLPYSLHRYLAEELLEGVPDDLQTALYDLALYGRVSRQVLDAQAPGRADYVFERAAELGFGTAEGEFELHPLIREFLLDKLLEHGDAPERIRAAIATCLHAEAWEQSVELVKRFAVADQIEPIVSQTFKPLVRTGRTRTLVELANEAAKDSHGFPSPVIDVVLADSALREGHLELAREHARRAAAKLPDSHPLASRAGAIVGQTSLFLWDFESSEIGFALALKAAHDDRDEAEALYGLSQAAIYGERSNTWDVVADLQDRRHRSPTDFLRAISAEVGYRLIGGLGGLSDIQLETARDVLPRAEDPRARSAATYICSYALSSEAKYAQAAEWLDNCAADIREFDLQFAHPFAEWVRARIALGQRRFADAERALAEVEDWSIGMNDRHHLLNARALRARLLLQTGDPEGALRNVSGTTDFQLSPSWRAEYLATRAIALAVLGRAPEATHAASKACEATTCSEAHLLAKIALAIAFPSRAEHRQKVVEQSEALSVWDPLVCGVRSSPLLADLLADDDETRASVEALYARTNDLALARRAGFRTRTHRGAHEVLTPRELEVLSLIARGYTNRDISRALYIADSTTKVHVRHILEKLGVRTRAEAVGRIRFVDPRDDATPRPRSD